MAILSVVVEKQRVAILFLLREAMDGHHPSCSGAQRGNHISSVSSIILSILLEKQEGVTLCLDSQEASCGHPLAHSSLLFSPLFLERPSPSFEREGMAILSVLLEKQRLVVFSLLRERQGVAILLLVLVSSG